MTRILSPCKSLFGFTAPLPDTYCSSRRPSADPRPGAESASLGLNAPFNILAPGLPSTGARAFHGVRRSRASARRRTNVRQNRVMVALRFFAKLRTRTQKRGMLDDPVPAVARRRHGPDRVDQAQEGLDACHAAGSPASRLR